MPPINWDSFLELPGAADVNFENLCRAIIRLQYGQYGTLAALANQPGVEFHLHLSSKCALGDPGRWYGWQCRWYEIGGAKPIGASRREKIKEAITITERVLPNLTDWVLWTRRPLTKGDQTWFYDIDTPMQLHLWTEQEVDSLLGGNAELLRATYFGELVLLPDALAEIHKRAVAPVKERWRPFVHQTIDAERYLQRMLGERASWDNLSSLADTIESEAQAIETQNNASPTSLSTDIQSTVRMGFHIAASLRDEYKGICEGQLEVLRLFPSTSFNLGQSISPLPRHLRARCNSLAPCVTNLIAYIRDGIGLLAETDDFLSNSVVAVLGEAGYGKTQLAAQLTAASSDRPAGILLLGRDLRGGMSLDELAARIKIKGKPVESFEMLVAALDAAGQRAGRRLPIIIDGLNEAEDPRDWRDELAALAPLLQAYPHVLVVCTLRNGFANDALPKDITQIEVPGFGDDVIEAAGKYFAYYRIDPTGTQLPLDLLRHPLMLWMVCEVTNPDRIEAVGLEKLPDSQSALFSCYLEQIGDRIGRLSSRDRRYHEQDVRKALYEIGLSLWEEKSRSLNHSALRSRLDGEHCTWDNSLVRALEMEGLLLRDPADPTYSQRESVIHDSVAGHLVADALLRGTGSHGISQWLNAPETISALTGDMGNGHPLAEDIFKALIGLLPRRLSTGQVWQIVSRPARSNEDSSTIADAATYTTNLPVQEGQSQDGPHGILPVGVDPLLQAKSKLRTRALIGASYLESTYLDSDTVEELTRIITQASSYASELFVRLWHTRAAPRHSLNAEFLDRALRTLSVTKRDLLWSEWLRGNAMPVLRDIDEQENRWQQSAERLSEDSLRARWLMWTLTSTVRDIRDLATRALYWFGRHNSEFLFSLAIESLSINDPYVSERMLAVVYGVAMARHTEPSPSEFSEQILAHWGRELYRLMYAPDAPHATTHMLARDYAYRTIELARRHVPDLLSDRELPHIKPPYTHGGIRAWGTSEDRDKERYRGGDAPLQMDFANYTLGSLVDDRRNYDFDHPEYTKIRANVMWRIYDLGYSLNDFSRIDQSIANANMSHTDRAQPAKTERYGKKYARIAYFELAGYLQDQGLPVVRAEDIRFHDADIDPSFPTIPACFPVVDKSFLGGDHATIAEWIRDGETPDMREYLIAGVLGDDSGPWVMLEGHLSQEDSGTGRRMFLRVHALLTKADEGRKASKLLSQVSPGELWLSSPRETHYVYAGEIPWCDTLRECEWEELRNRSEKQSGDSLPRLSVLRDGAEGDEADFEYLINGLKSSVELSENAIPSESSVNEEVESDDTDLGDLSVENILGLLYPLYKDTFHVLADARGLELEFDEGTDQHALVDDDSVHVLIPTLDYVWHGQSSVANPPVSAIILAKQIAQTLDLLGRADTFDLFAPDDTRATCTRHCEIGDRQNQSFLFMRQSELEKYMAKEELALTWVVWGERTYAGSARIWDSSDLGQADAKPWEQFSSVVDYDSDRPDPDKAPDPQNLGASNT